MMFMGFGHAGGLGNFQTDYSAGNCARVAPSVDGTQMECIDASGNVISSAPFGSSGGGSTTPNTDTNQPWWSIGLKSLVQGAAAGLTTPAPTTTPIATVATPWYQTPVGMIGIVLGVLGAGYLFLKK